MQTAKKIVDTLNDDRVSLSQTVVERLGSQLGELIENSRADFAHVDALLIDGSARSTLAALTALRACDYDVAPYFTLLSKHLLQSDFDVFIAISKCIPSSTSNDSVGVGACLPWLDGEDANKRSAVRRGLCEVLPLLGHEEFRNFMRCSYLTSQGEVHLDDIDICCQCAEIGSDIYTKEDFSRRQLNFAVFGFARVSLVISSVSPQLRKSAREALIRICDMKYNEIEGDIPYLYKLCQR
jgi:hypothetical protein